MEALVKVLKLSAQGLPQSWISLEQAVVYYAAQDVRWEAGQEIAVFHGGHNAITGEQSIIKVNSIIGTRGVHGINPFELRQIAGAGLRHSPTSEVLLEESIIGWKEYELEVTSVVPNKLLI